MSSKLSTPNSGVINTKIYQGLICVKRHLPALSSPLANLFSRRTVSIRFNSRSDPLSDTDVVRMSECRTRTRGRGGVSSRSTRKAWLRAQPHSICLERIIYSENLLRLLKAFFLCFTFAYSVSLPRTKVVLTKQPFFLA